MPAFWLEALVVLLGLTLLMIEAFSSSHSKELIRRGAIGGLLLILCFFSFAKAPDFESNAELARYYAWDSTAIFFKILAIVATVLSLFMAYDYRRILNHFTFFRDTEESTGEYYILPVFACAGMMWMASARDLVSIFVALELTTITFYILVAYMRRQVGSLEAGVKYLILGALSTAFLVYGIAWIYGTLGTTNLEAITAALAKGSESGSAIAQNPTAVLFGFALILLALAFKVGAVPMQLWIPDVYQGAPTPTAAFLSVGSKAAGFAVAMRTIEPFINEGSVLQNQAVMIVLTLAGLTILIGNLSAIPQGNFKRLLAYSSIAHAGFLLLMIAAWSEGSETSLSTKQAVAFYLGSYMLLAMGAFFVLVVIRSSEDSDEISAFEGLGRRNPHLALCTTVLLAALAGLPLTAGFFGKFFAFQLAIESAMTNKALWWGVGIGFIGTAAGFYYYLKVVRAMYLRAGTSTEAIPVPRISRIAITSLATAALVLGVWPQPVLWLVGH